MIVYSDRGTRRRGVSRNKKVVNYGPTIQHMAASTSSPESETRHTSTSDNCYFTAHADQKLETRSNKNEGSTPAKATKTLQRPEKGYRTYKTDGPQRVHEKLSLGSPAGLHVPEPHLSQNGTIKILARKIRLKRKNIRSFSYCFGSKIRHHPRGTVSVLARSLQKSVITSICN